MIKLVIFDWAGTTIDFGCMAPVYAFKQAFKEIDIDVTFEEIRKPMGMLKIDHIKTMFEMKSIKDQFLEKKKRNYNDEDINLVYELFEKILFKDLELYTNPIPGVLETVQRLKEMNIKIGSTTGYTSKMIRVVAPRAKINGYSPGFLATADMTGKGRPDPSMIELNKIFFEIKNSSEVLKVGDTVSDILEGKNANCISACVIEGSSELGLSEKEFNETSLEVLEKESRRVYNTFKKYEPDYILNKITDLIPIIESLNKK